MARNATILAELRYRGRGRRDFVDGDLTIFRAVPAKIREHTMIIGWRLHYEIKGSTERGLLICRTEEITKMHKGMLLLSKEMFSKISVGT